MHGLYRPTRGYACLKLRTVGTILSIHIGLPLPWNPASAFEGRRKWGEPFSVRSVWQIPVVRVNPHGAKKKSPNLEIQIRGHRVLSSGGVALAPVRERKYTDNPSDRFELNHHLLQSWKSREVEGHGISVVHPVQPVGGTGAI
jgi:hypothetical protein